MNNAIASITPAAIADVPSLRVMPRPATLEWRRLHAVAKAALLVCSDDTTRANLNSVLFRMRDKRLTVCATDGHRLLKMDIELQSIVDECEFLISRSDLQQWAKIVPPKNPKKSRLPEVEICVYCEPGRVSFVSAGCHHSFAPVPDTLFPPYNEVIPAGAVATEADGLRKVPVATAFAAQYLIDLGSVAKLIGRARINYMVKLEVAKKDLEPTRCDIEGDGMSSIYVLMPMRF